MRAVTFAVLALSAQVKRERRTPPPARRSLACARRNHQIGENAKNAVGPVLNGVISRKAGSVA